MCFGSKDKSDDAPAPKPAQQQSSSSKVTASMPQQYAPPSGPPPSHASYQQQPQAQSSSSGYAPPPGPPPTHQAQQAGPLPSKNNPFLNGPSASSSQQQTTGDFAPPPGPPPPSQGQAEGGESKDKQHDWQTAVPDTSLLPPPPNFFGGYDRSPANNATEEECEAGERWCRQYPPYPGMPYSEAAASAVLAGNVAVYAPPSFRGSISQIATGVWRGSSDVGNPDTCLATYPPLYHAAAHTPRVPGRRYTAYYEVRILKDGSRSSEVGLALGYVAPPYPGFRLPGWHRGSLGVHGDDGHKYVNDRWGGKSFARPFRRGETVGLGMDFFLTPANDAIGVEIFLTRDGREAGRWDLHEETDRVQDLPVTGLEGYNDVCAAVGVFDKVAFEVVFAPEQWAWKGHQG
ncbi:hypothetical protein GGR53DRAFT_487551 [Hypoxylon sp. FL1150]|nr:hypothetical protein GGR53DRAFT_487551 [Hypoxylon sp. FL1150]